MFRRKIAAAAKEVGVQLFCPSEFGRDIGKRDRGYLRRQGGYAGKVESDGCAVRRFLQWPVLGYGLDTAPLLIICYLLPLALVLPVQLLKPASTGSYNLMS